MQTLKKPTLRALAFVLTSPLILGSCETMTLISDRMNGRGTERSAAEIVAEARAAVCLRWLNIPYTRSTPSAVRAHIIENNAARDAYCGSPDAQR